MACRAKTVTSVVLWKLLNSTQHSIIPGPHSQFPLPLSLPHGVKPSCWWNSASVIKLRLYWFSVHQGNWAVEEARPCFIGCLSEVLLWLHIRQREGKKKEMGEWKMLKGWRETAVIDELRYFPSLTKSHESIRLKFRTQGKDLVVVMVCAASWVSG